MPNTIMLQQGGAIVDKLPVFKIQQGLVYPTTFYTRFRIGNKSYLV